MKILYLFIALLAFQSVGYSQYKKATIIKEVDEMTLETYYYPSRHFIVANKEKTKGFSIGAHLNENNMFDDIIATIYGLGGCVENSTIIVLLQGDRRITIKSWNKFNCDGTAYFDVPYEDIELLRTYPIVKIRITNGFNYEEYTGDVLEEDSRYFIDIINASTKY
jgi:hypothetical protein